MKRRFVHVAVAAGSLLLAVWVIVGCETQSATAPIDVSPASATLTVGQSQEFVATGCFDYNWSLSDSSIGTLSDTSGNRVTYTDTASPATNSVLTQVITVVSSLPGQTGSTGGSNAAPVSVSAQASVVQE